MRRVIVSSLCLATVYQWTAVSAFLFLGRDAAETTTALPKSLQTLMRVVKTSENAIGWLENKTSSSLKGLLNSESQAFNDVKVVTTTPHGKHFFTWLRERLHYASSPESGETSSDDPNPGDSEESLIILHRTQDHGFSWGASVRNKSQEHLEVEGTAGPDKPASTVTGRSVQSALTYIYQMALALTERGNHILQDGLAKVFALKSNASIQKFWQGFPWINSTARTSQPAEDCGGGDVQPVCAVDIDKRFPRFTVFLDPRTMTRHNQEHGTKFRVYANDVCIDLLARQPEWFYNAQKR